MAGRKSNTTTGNKSNRIAARKAYRIDRNKIAGMKMKGIVGMTTNRTDTRKNTIAGIRPKTAIRDQLNMMNGRKPHMMAGSQSSLTSRENIILHG